jgi:hypothetical protein
MAADNTPYWYFDQCNSDFTVGAVQGAAAALAMRGWYTSFGFDETLQAAWDFWMASITAANCTPADDVRKENLIETGMGTYAPSEQGLTSALFVENLETGLRLNSACDDCMMGVDLATLGLLADLWNAREPAGFATAKAFASKKRRRRMRLPLEDSFDVPALIRYIGFDGQVAPINGTTAAWRPAHALDALGAAMFGLVYRRAPKIYATKDHPPRR